MTGLESRFVTAHEVSNTTTCQTSIYPWIPLSVLMLSIFSETRSVSSKTHLTISETKFLFMPINMLISSKSLHPYSRYVPSRLKKLLIFNHRCCIISSVMVSSAEGKGRIVLWQMLNHLASLSRETRSFGADGRS